MRILMLTNAMESGGAETHIMTLAEELVRRGHRVVVASSGGQMVRALEEKGIEHRQLPLASRSPLSLWRARCGLRRWLCQESFDVLHAHARIPAFLASGLCERRGICFVTTVHARWRGGLRRLVSRLGIRTAAVGEDLRQRVILSYGAEPEQVLLIPNGVDTDRFCPSDKPVGGGELRILCMSRMDRDCSLAARVLCLLAPRLSSLGRVSVTLVGGGDDWERVRRMAATAEQSGATVRCVGRVSDPTPYLRECDIFVGVSRAALEAMACGACVILGGDEGFFGVLEGENAATAALENFCARSGDALNEERLWESLARLCEKTEEERREMGVALREFVCLHHSAARMGERTEALYANAAEAFSRRSADPDAKGRVLLCGYYGFGNLGDDTLLHASIRRARSRFPDHQVLALTRRGARDGKRFCVPCVKRTSFFAVRRAIRSADAVVFGGGTLLQELTSRRSLRYYTFLLSYAQKRGIPCELWANGLGPLLGEGSRRRVARLLRGCRYVGLRDHASRALAAEMGVSCLPDPDMGLKTRGADDCRVSYLLRRVPVGARLVGVAVKGDAPRGLLREMMLWLGALRREGITLVFIPLYPAEDLRLSRRLCKRFDGVLTEGVSSSDAVGIFARCEAVCSMRLHGLVFAAAAGVPFVGFGRDPKLVSFCRERGGVEWEELL